MTEKENKKPAAQLRLSRLKAAIWENTSEKGSFYNVTFSRLYLENGGKKKAAWRDSSSFGRDDLLLLAKLADQAHTWIVEKSQEPVEADSE